MDRIAITNVTAITMDPGRRVLDRASILLEGDRIAAVTAQGARDPVADGAREVIDGTGMIALPGLIDCHSHAGHGLVRNLGGGDVDAWFGACAEIYARGSDTGFWRAEARLAALERLKAGVTSCVTLLGGGADVMRTDDPAAGEAHCAVTREFGLRTMLAVGPGRPPFPLDYRSLDGGAPIAVSFERQLEVCDALIRAENDFLGRGTGICLIMPVFQPAEAAGREAEIRVMCDAVMALRARHGVPFTQDGHRTGSIALAQGFGLLGPFALLSHSVDLNAADIAALKASSARVVHNPSAIMSILGRCPVPELLAEGVGVALGSDAAAPDRGYDMFRHMAQCLHYHRRHFRDPDVLKPAQVLEMCTIGAARALGIECELGSLESGKKADLILVDGRKPHLYPPIMPLTRVVHFANAADVDTVIVNGRVLMRGRATRVDEAGVLAEAAGALEGALRRTGLEDLASEAPA